MIDQQYSEFKALVKELYSVQGGQHDRRALQFILEEKFSESKADSINKCYKSGFDATVIAIRNFEKCSVNILGFDSPNPSEKHLATRFLVGYWTDEQMQEQAVADTVQAVFFAMLGLEKLMKRTNQLVAQLFKQNFNSEVEVNVAELSRTMKMYVEVGVPSPKIPFVMLELFVKAYNSVFPNSKLFDLM